MSPFRKAVVAALATGELCELESAGNDLWSAHFRWLDRSGLALPLAVQLLNSSPARLSRAVATALLNRLNDNQLRMTAMLESLALIQQALTNSGVSFCVLKGFSLIPECYASIRERHQVDFDFLIDIRDASAAMSAVEPLGYMLLSSSRSGEIRLSKPWQNRLNAHSWLYDISEGPALELHSRLWEPETTLVDFAIPTGALSDIETTAIRGVRIPRLTPAWQFVSLVLHAFRHLVDSWLRLISLYEISLYIRREENNCELLQRVIQVADADSSMAAAFALVLGMVRFQFLDRLPHVLAVWCDRHLTSESALWLRHYSESWLFADPPGTKLSLLVQRQFSGSTQAWRAYLLRRLLPPKAPDHLCENATPQAQRSISYSIDDALYRFGRLGYHLRSNWQLLRAYAGWSNLMRVKRTQAAPPANGLMSADESRT